MQISLKYGKIKGHTCNKDKIVIEPNSFLPGPAAKTVVYSKINAVMGVTNKDIEALDASDTTAKHGQILNHQRVLCTSLVQ